MIEPPEAEVLVWLDDAEVESALDTIFAVYGYKFHGYQQVFIKRRLRALMSANQVSNLTELKDRIRTDPSMYATLMDAMSISVTEMFRDPQMFLALRKHVVPVLQTYPFVRIWVAGCASGEEAFSLSILLSEEGMDGRFQIYATDIHEPALVRARAGVISGAAMQLNTRNYQDAGGTSDFSRYYTAGHGMALLGHEWRSPILFSRHDLVQGSSFNEFQLVLCRNVMIYFDQQLRTDVHNLLSDSLVPFGFLVLGQKESIRFSSHDRDYQPIDETHKIYKKIR